jgi:hypothetical protein
MKVFVSGQILEKERIREVYGLLRECGHTITHDWTLTDSMPASYSDSPSEAALRAQKDIEGVLAADAYLIIADNQVAGKGMYVELGTALALASARGQGFPILLVGPMRHESIFYYHPHVRRFAVLSDALHFLNSSKAGLSAA